MKKLVGLLLVSLLAAAPLTGCQGGSNIPAQSQPESSAVKQKSSPASKSSDVTLNIYAFQAAYEGTMNQMAADYLEKTGVTLAFDIPSSNEPYTVLKARFAAGSGPDIMGLSNGDFSSWGERCLDLSNEPWLAHADQMAVEAMTVDGKQYGFPMNVDGSGIVYNRELFEKAGITSPPETLDELEKACEKLKAAGIQPFGEAWKEWGFLMHIFGTVFAYEGNLADTSAKLASHEMGIQNLKYIDNFFRLFDMTVNDGWGAESVGYDYSAQLSDFLNGKMAMVKQGTWLSATLLADNPDMKVGLFAVPLTNDPADTKLTVSPTGFIAINKDSPYAEECRSFINWLAEPENQEKYMVQGFKNMPPFDNVDVSSLGELYVNTQQYMAEGKTIPFGNELWPVGFNSDQATPLQAYAAGTITKENCIEQLQSEYDKRLAETAK